MKRKWTRADSVYTSPEMAPFWSPTCIIARNYILKLKTNAKNALFTSNLIKFQLQWSPGSSSLAPFLTGAKYMFIAHVKRSREDCVILNRAEHIYQKFYCFVLATYLVIIIEHLVLGSSDLTWNFYLTIYKVDEFQLKDFKNRLNHWNCSSSNTRFKIFSSSCAKRAYYPNNANKINFLQKLFTMFWYKCSKFLLIFHTKRKLSWDSIFLIESIFSIDVSSSQTRDTARQMFAKDTVSLIQTAR